MTPEQEIEFEQSFEKLVLGLTKHFGRKPTLPELVAYAWGTPERRKEIYDNKGLPDGS